MEKGTHVSGPQGNGPQKQDVQKKEPLVELGGMWGRKNKAGNWYATGSSGNVRYLLIPNQFKTKDSQPDYKLCVCKRPPPDKAKAANSGPQAGSAGQEDNYDEQVHQEVDEHGNPI